MEASYVPTVTGDIPSRLNQLRFVREFLAASNMAPGYYMEFGVLNGEAIVEAWRMLRGQVSHYFGFDTFLGLPDLSDHDKAGQSFMPAFHKGNFHGMAKHEVQRSILKHTRMCESQLTLVEGDFKHTLPSFDKLKLAAFGRCAVCYIDCDLYSSSIEVFRFIDDIVGTGTWLFLDDYWCYRGHPNFGQRRAFEEWLNSSKRIGATEYGNFRGWGKVFVLFEK